MTLELEYFLLESLRVNNNDDFFECYGFRPFDGKDGCGVLAYNLKQYCRVNRIKLDVSGSYSEICVKFYNLNPPVDAKQWIMWVS